MRSLVAALLALLGVISLVHSQECPCSCACDIYIVLTASDTMVELPSLMVGAREGLANWFAALQTVDCDTRVSVCAYGTTAEEQITPDGPLDANLIQMVGGISRLDLGIGCARLSREHNHRPGVCSCLVLIVSEDPLGFGGSVYTEAAREQIARLKNETNCREDSPFKTTSPPDKNPFKTTIKVTLTTVSDNVYYEEISDLADNGSWIHIPTDFTGFRARTEDLLDLEFWRQFRCCQEDLPTPTTTPRPTRPPRPGVCDDCIIIQGIGYKHVDGECRKFIQCFFDGSVPPYMEKWTALGTFWDTPQVEQRIPRDVICQWDLCTITGPSLRGWEDDRNCAGYWLCGYIDGTWRTLEWVCCDVNEMWDNLAMQCVNDALDICDTPCPVELPTTLPFDCPMEVRADPRYYFDMRDPNAEDQSCAEGMEFNKISCTCTGTPVEDPCEPILHVTFDGGEIKDTSIHHNWIANKGGVVAQTDDDTNWYGVFNGNAHLFVPGLANLDLRNDWAFVVDYDGQNSPDNNNVALIGNKNCLKPFGAYYLALTNPSTVECYVKTQEGEATASVTAPSGGMNHAICTYRATTGLTLSVGTTFSNTPIEGLMWRDDSMCSFHIGWGEGFESFTGRIYEVTVYRDPDCIPDNL